MFRRPGRRFESPVLPSKLRRAHRLLTNGEFEKAVLAFHDLARKAEERFPERAPMLYLEAGRAGILAGLTGKGIAHFRSGLTLLATQKRYARLKILGEGIVAELSGRGLTTKAGEIALLIQNNLPAGAPQKAQAAAKSPPLPTHCPNCGATLRPGEIEWLDDVTAGCDYCGSSVRGET